MINLFVNNTISAEELALIVEGNLEMKLSYVSSDFESKKGYTKEGVAIWFHSKHDLENDRDMCFERFKYNIDFERTYRNNAHAKNLELDFAYKVIHALLEIKDIELMLTEDVQKLLYIKL